MGFRGLRFRVQRSQNRGEVLGVTVPGFRVWDSVYLSFKALDLFGGGIG